MKETSADDARTRPFPIIWVLCGLTAFAIIVRIAQFAHYRALFHDEALLASNVLDRSTRELFLPYGDSMAPGAYMLLTKLAFMVGGVNEYAARFLPFLSGIVLVLVFYPVARRLTSPTSALIALGFLAVSKYLIEFSDFVRPYSSDALITVLLLGLALYTDSEQSQWRRYAQFGLFGAAAIWCSYPALFMLAGIGTVQLAWPLLQGEYARVRYPLGACVAWGLSFLMFYWVSIRSIRADADTMFLMNDYYQYANAFMPFPPTSFSDLKWFNYHSIKTFEYPGGLTLPGLGAFAFILGSIALYKHNRKHLAYLLVPIAFALVASGLERYPFWARTILWLAPILYILIGEGIASLWEEGRSPKSTIAVVLILMTMFVPGVRAMRMIPEPSSHHELNKALDYVVANREDDDLMFIRHWDADAFRFCRWRYGFADDAVIIEPNPLTVGQEEGEYIEQQFPTLKASGKVWFALAYDFPEQAHAFLEQLDLTATRVAESHALGASAYLYDFREQPPAVE